MNSKKIFLALAGASISLLAQAQECPSHAYVPRGISTDLTYINALTFAHLYPCNGPKKQFTYVGQAIWQQSRKSKDLGSAFLLGTGNQITVQQAPFAAGTPNTINSVTLGLGNAAGAAPFLATFSLSPQRKLFAYHGYFHANLDDWWCGLWFDAAIAIVNARHTLNAVEAGNISTGCPGISSVCDALSNPALRYGRYFCGLCNDEKRRTGFDDFQLRLGYDTQWCDTTMLGVYIVGTIPGGRKPTAEYVFEPLVGSRHSSIGVGLHANHCLEWCGCEDANLMLMTDFNYRYVFSHKECRTFDLLPNGAFSRFLPLVNLGAPMVAISGVNLLTQKVNIQPRSTIQWWLGVNYEYCDWNVEVGYNLWWRQKERVKADSISFPLNTAVFDVTTGLPGPALTLANINVDSALARRALTNKVYGALSFDGCLCDNCFEWMAGFGGSYEFVVKHDRCGALNNWAIFGKAAVSF